MRRRYSRLVIVLVGIVLGQFILYGPSLIGRKILLPLDILAEPNVYLPRTPELAGSKPHDSYFSDLIYQFEPERRFAAAELHKGRLPMWAPYHFAGVPFVWPKFSPILLFGCVTESPVILAWAQMFAALIAGMGVYAFCRRALAVGFWPAAIIAWCYPLTGFFVYWQGYPVGMAVYFLPWLLLAVHQTVRRTAPWAPIGLSVATVLVLVTGHLDVAGQVLLVSGFYSLWCLWDEFRENWFQRAARRVALALVVGWGLGFLMAAPYLLPVLEYTQTGTRIARRSAGAEERPPAGLATLPLAVLPDYYGSTQRGSVPVPPGRQTFIESAAVAYTGIVVTLLVAPMAWGSQRRRSAVIFWSCLAVFGLSWCLDLPGFVDLLRLPGLNLMSHNRLVFATSFAILALAAIGLEELAQGRVQWRRGFWLPAGLLAGLSALCACRAVLPLEPIATQLEAALRQGAKSQWFDDLAGVRTVQAWFFRHNVAAALWAGAGFAGWMFLRRRPERQARLLPALGLVLAGDLLWFAWGRNAQCDPAWYYPRLPVLAEIAQNKPGRIMGYGCLPASLAMTQDLRDLRGYDAVDPARLMDLMELAAAPESKKFPYALTQWIAPRIELNEACQLRLSPILDLLGVRQVLFRNLPPAGCAGALSSADYWALENLRVLPRVFVPARVEVELNDIVRLQQMAAPEFDPRAVAYVETLVSLPTDCRGGAEIIEEIPTRIKIAVDMETPGLVVLADLWDKGWHATVNGQPATILRADHALRGVVLPAGKATLEFRYAPESFTWGLRLAGLGLVSLLVWAALLRYRSKTHAQSD